MTSQRGIRAGRAFVELFADNSKLVSGLRAARAKLTAFGRDIQRFGVRLTTAITAAIVPIGAITIKAASDAQETMSRFAAVFRDQAKVAGEFADEIAKSIGRSKYEMRDALATFQSFFVGLGFGGQKARELSQELQKTALDFASFHNLSDAEALQRFISALSGSGEVLDRFGINIKQAALQQELLRMGIDKSWTAVTEQEKALARLNLIMRAMGDQGAMGDAARTADSFANRMKKLKGFIRDTSVDIGTALLPVVTPLVTKLTEIVQHVSEWAQANGELLTSLSSKILKVAAVVAAVGVLSIAIGQLSKAMAGLILVTKAAVVAFTFLAAHPVVAVLLALVAAGAVLVYTINRLQVHTAELSDKMTALREATQKSLIVDKAKADRLRELAEKQKLTSAEMDEAERLTKELETSYGDLGITLDRTTSSIKGMADAYERLTGLMRQNMVAAVDKQIQELGANIRELRKEAVSISKSFFGGVRIEKIEGINQQILAIERQRNALLEERRRIAGGDLGVLDTGGGEAGGGGVLPRGEVADKSGGRWLAQQMRRVQDLALETKLQGNELEQARLDLARKRALSDLPEGIGPSGEFWTNLEYDLRQKLLDANIGGAIADAVGQVTGVYGTFGTEALNRIGLGSDIEERQLDELGEIRRNTRRLVEDGGLAFT